MVFSSSPWTFMRFLVSTLILIDFQYFFHLSLFSFGLICILDLMLETNSDECRLLLCDSNEEVLDKELFVDTNLYSLDVVDTLLDRVGLDRDIDSVLTVEVLLPTLGLDLLLNFVVEFLSKT